MKLFSKPAGVSWFCFGTGLLCLLLRQWLLTAGVNDAGLLDHTHPGYRLSWLLVPVVTLILFLSRKQQTRVRFSYSGTRVLGLVLRALGYLAAAAMVRVVDHPLKTVTAVLGGAAALCNLFQAVQVIRKKRTPPLTYGADILFLLMYMVCRYGAWSSEPELQRSFFHMAALGSLALTAYRRGVFALDRKDWKGYLLLSRWALFACLGAIPGSPDALSLALWALGLLLDGCSPTAPRKSQ